MDTKKKPLTDLILVAIISLGILGCGEILEDPASTQNSEPLDEWVVESGVERDFSPQVPQESILDLVAGNNEFAFDLYQALRADSGNIFFSPFSISTALAMIYGGARGETERQMAQTLQFTLSQQDLPKAFNALDLTLNRPEGSDQEDQEFQLSVANSLWGQIDYEYQAEFIELLSLNYGAALREVDFVDEKAREQARLAINQWVSDNTEGKIEDLIPEDILSELTRMVLANAIYFRADWQEPFLNGTNQAEFSLLDGRKVDVPMMSRRALTPYIEGQNFQAVKIPYHGGEIAMIVILPEEGQFQAVEQALDIGLIESLSDDFEQRDVKMYLPRFEFESSFSLAENLIAMGMPDAFDADKADFTGITVQARPRLYIRHVLHKAFIAVNELGTEAAASTAGIAEITSMPIEVRINRPFLFLIRDFETGSVLFVGRMVDPGQ